MDIFSACGTWVYGWPDYRKIVEYIDSCEIFPNIRMIVEATGVTAERAEHAVKHIFAQENRCFSRFFFIAGIDGAPITEITKEEMMIYSYLEREEEGKDFSSRAVIRSFMGRHRYYDDDGNIKYRFSERKVVKAVKAYNRYFKKSDEKTGE